jgi:tRNA(Ile)-lysidine synthase
MHKALANEILTDALFEKDNAIVIGVSGGPDSMALLHLLLDLNKKLAWKLRLHVAHVNHTLRGEEAEEDAAFVQAAADSLGLPCSMSKVDVAAKADREPGSIEEIGRRERYAFFEKVCLQVDAGVVAVGHHADDNAETILHRVLRGTGLRGLSGIPRSRRISPASQVRVVRPLLRHTSRELLAYLDDSGIAYHEDRTNQSSEPMRNRIRNVLLPRIEADFNPQVRDALNRLGEQAFWLEEYLRETIQRTFETLIISHTDQELSLNVNALARKSRIVQTEIVRLAYTSFGLGEQELSFAHLVSALDLIADPGSGKQIQLPGGMTIEKRYHQLIFSLPSEEPREMIAPEVAVHLPGQTVLALRQLEIHCSIEEIDPGDIPVLRRKGSPYEEYVDFRAVQPPLVVRGRRPGDRFFPLGAPGSKKLSDFLTDNKVAPRERERVAILCDHLGPIWVIGHRIDERVKLTALTRQVLHLRAKRLEP